MKVITISGREADRKDVIKIKENYYLKNVDVVKIDKKWYRVSNNVYFNTREEKWRLRTQFTRRIVTKVFDDKSLLVGMDELSDGNIMGMIDNLATYFDNINIANDYVRIVGGVIKDNIVFGISQLTSLRGNTSINGKFNGYHSAYYPIPQKYNAEGLFKELSKYRLHYKKYDGLTLPEDEPTIPMSDVVSNVLSKYTYGIEYETSSGRPEFEQVSTAGLIPLKDGSIKGFEFASIVMNGNKVMNFIDRHTSVLSECEIDSDCSLHVHIGIGKSTENEILKIRNTFAKIQDELGDMMNKHIFNSGKYKSSGKNYCKRLYDYVSSFRNLYTYSCGYQDQEEAEDNSNDTHYQSEMEKFFSVNYGIDLNDIDLERPHPSDVFGDRKWNVSSRYSALNINGLMFGTRNTVEFRMHTPTLNRSKITNWLLICTAIVDFSLNSGHTDIDVISLSDILKSVYKNGEESKILEDYIAERVSFCNENFSKGDKYNMIDIAMDKQLVYKTPINYKDVR